MTIKPSLILLVLVVLAFASFALAESGDFENTRDPEQKYRECLERCERRHKGQSFQERCRDDCQVRRKQTEERREQERGGDRGRHEEQKRREEERAREEEEEREREKGGGGGSRGREEQQREEEQRRERQKGGGGRGREEQQREEERREEQREDERRREQQKGGGGRGREEQQREEERREEQREDERRREQQKGGGGRGREEQQREEERRREQEKGSRQGQGERARKEEEQQQQGDNLIREVTSRDPKYSREESQEKEQEGESGQQGDNNNPFVFQGEHFRTIFQTQQGRERVLPKFTERSKLFKGIQDYRLLVIEAEPQTFILPKHYDADTVFFVAQGKGTVTIVRQNKRESFNIKRGDVAVLPSGVPVYVINPSSNEKLVVLKLLRPVNTPGRFEYFFGAGGEEPESFYRAFSTEILEAAFNTRRDKFERIFGQQRQGEMVKVTEEQIKRLSQHEEEGGIWPFSGETKSSKVNIFKQEPTHSNQYGQMYDVDGSKLQQLRDFDVSVSFTNISQGSMSTVMYNSRATKIAIVLNGEGYFEMACPHLSQSRQGSRQQEQQGQGSRQQEQQGQGSRQQEQQGQGSRQQEQQGQGSSPSYQKVSAQLKRGVVVVIPAGHPHVNVASENQNLEIVLFAINANNNERFPLAGKANVINQFERAAKELAFGVHAREVDEVFRSQKEDFFFKGPSQKQHRGQGV